MRRARIFLLLGAICAVGWALVANRSGYRLAPNLTAAAALLLVALAYLRR